MANKYFYKGTQLKEICIQKDYNYVSIIRIIRKTLKENPNLSVDEAVISVVDNYIKVPKNNVKYYYKGLPLKQYCEKHNINYSKIKSRIIKLKESDPKLTVQEIVNKVMKNQYHLGTTLFYKGIPLKQYCKEHNDMYYKALCEKIKKETKKNPNLSIDDIVDNYIQRERKNGYKYYYKGIPLIIYCRLNNINYSSIYSKIIRKAKSSDLPLNEIIEDAFNSYYKFEIKYFYNEIPLHQYCLENDINYGSILSNVSRQMKKKEKDIQTIINDSIHNYKKRTQWYYTDDITLVEKCKLENIPREPIYNRLKTLSEKNIFNTSKERIDFAIEQYIKSREIKQQNAIFEYLKELKSIEEEDLKNICSLLNIKFITVKNLINLGFTYYQSINIIWYYHDNNEKEELDISEDKLKEIFCYMDKISKENESKIKKEDLFKLYRLYKCQLKDTRDLMLLNIKNYVNTTIKNILYNYKIKYKKEIIEEFESISILTFLTLIEKINTYYPEKFITYFDKTIKNTLKRKIKEFYYEKKSLTLNELSYENSGREKIEDIEYNKTINDKNYSEEMIEILMNLDENDRNYIFLRFQEQYSYEELANYYQTTIAEVMEKEKILLNKLKKEDTLINLTKKLKFLP